MTIDTATAPETDTDATEGVSWWRVVGFAGRAVQVTLAGLAAVFILGAVMGGMSAFALVVLGVVALVLLAFVAVVEWVIVRPAGRRASG